MNSSELRQSFIDFFKQKGHTYVPSESLMPSAPNLLFTNSGMNQFVPLFLGDRHPSYSRAVNTQKCIRAGGKHNDLEDVGFDTYHHTFFEMLGNWSFGDYFKKEAIEWAWELVTKVWKFPKNRLYATVYKPGPNDPSTFDQEAYDFWKAIFIKEGLDPSVHIVYGNKKDNFWMMGETGPCGPCTEIHVDLTEKGDTQGKLVNSDSPYCIEIWNLVFIQFNAGVDGSFKPLAHKHVDTGMGLERVAGIIANTKNFTDYSKIPSNYSSDLFTGIFEKLTKLSDIKYTATVPMNRNNMSKQELIDCAFRVLADHIRTLSFAIADGILPGNEGRNYVLRRILRRAVLFGRYLNLNPGFFGPIIDTVIEKMGGFFPEIRENRSLIHKVIENEEKAFDRTLDRGLQLLDKITHKSKIISGKEAFTLYDTYGFPIDLTQLIARERKLQVDIDGFNKEMQMQRDRARTSQKKTIITVSEDGESKNATVFVGYEKKKLKNLKATIVSIISNENKNYLVFDKTPFYAEMGGQMGDTGDIQVKDEIFKVSNTIKDDYGHVLHEVTPEPSQKLVGKKAILSVNIDRREEIQRNHTATHLLHWALRKVLGTHVKQAGSLVAMNHLRFDFSHFEALTREQLNQIEFLVNQKILENSPVKWYEVAFSKKPENCIAFFGEKYGEVVRVVDINSYSQELCGGTHVCATGEIGLFKIISESAIAAGTRRIEATTGLGAVNLANNYYSQIHELSKSLSCKPEELSHRIEALQKQRSDLEVELRKFNQKDAAAQADDIIKSAHTHNGIKWVVAQVSISNPNDMRSIAVKISKELGPSVVILANANTSENKVTALALCSPEANQKGYQAGDLVQNLCSQLGGKGGGKPDYAMGGAKNPEKLPETLKNFTPYLQKA